MMKKHRKIAASFMTVALALCIGYLSFMSPTSAWFYKSGVIDSGDSFVFGDLSVNTDFAFKGRIQFDGATKLSDPEETLFDSVVEVSSVFAHNAGTIPARIYVDVKTTNGMPGLKWFAYTEDMLVDDSIKNMIVSTIGSTSDKALNTYNIGADGQSGHYIMLNPGEIVPVKVATWVDYDSVGAYLEAGAAVNYDVEITLIASQDVDGAITR